jgi:hypothetical protein
MKNDRKRLVKLLSCSLALGCLAFASCATPASRIRANQELFDTYPTYVRDMVREGEIEQGFTEDMVQMALGDPDRRYTRTAYDGATTVWSYTGTYTSPVRQRVRGTFRVRDSDGRYRTIEDDIWVDVDQVHEYERKRVEFQRGMVVGIEEIEVQRSPLPGF